LNALPAHSEAQPQCPKHLLPTYNRGNEYCSLGGTAHPLPGAA
jgi:hypothetical protein